jgi:hypothetical protein
MAKRPCKRDESTHDPDKRKKQNLQFRDVNDFGHWRHPKQLNDAKRVNRIDAQVA